MADLDFLDNVIVPDKNKNLVMPVKPHVQSALGGEEIGPATNSFKGTPSAYKGWDIFKGTPQQRQEKMTFVPHIMKQNGVSFEEAAKNYDKYRPGLGDRVIDAAGKLGTGAVAAGAIMAPIPTAVGVGTYMALDKLFNVNKWIPDDTDDNLRSAAQIADMVVKTSFAGGMMKGLPDETPSLAGLPRASLDLFKNILSQKNKQVNGTSSVTFTPDKLQQIQDVIGKKDVPNLTPTVKVGDTTMTGIDHQDALEKLGMSKDTHTEGKDFQAGFTTDQGSFITREQSQQPPYKLPEGHSEDMYSEDFKDFMKSVNIDPKKLSAAKEGVLINAKSEDLADLTKKPYWNKIAPLLTDYNLAEDPVDQEPVVVAKNGDKTNLKKGMDKIGEFLKKGDEAIQFSNDLQLDFQKHIIGGSASDELGSKELLKEINLKPSDASLLTLYHDDRSIPISDYLKEFYNKVGLPILDKSTEIFNQLKGKEYPVNSPHLARFVKDRGGFFDRVKSGIASAGKSGILRRTTDSMKARVMRIAIDDEGKRQVVSIKRGNVMAWTDGKGRDLGRLNVKKYSEVMEKELAPLERQAKKLEDEQDILQSGKAVYKAKFSRSQGIDLKLAKLYDKIADVYDKHGARWDNADMERKVFVDKDGKTWKLSDATIPEIEKNTDVRYHKNFLLNALKNYTDLRKAQRAAQFIDGIKQSSDFKQIAMKQGEGETPEGWKSTKLPQFRGYALDPIVADTLDYFDRRIYGFPDNWRLFTAVNRVLRDSIFYNPLMHIPNIAGFWTMNRGLMKWVMPKEYAGLWKTSGRAMEAVRTQNGDYRSMLESGANLLYHENSGMSLDDLIRKNMGEEIEKNPDKFKQLAEDFGYANPLNFVKAIYDFSHKATWSSNDFLTMQAIYEHMDSTGSTLENSIQHVGKFIPNYIIPARIGEPLVKVPGLEEAPKGISELMSNPNVTMFGAYHYGALRSYGEMMRALIQDTPEVRRGEVLDKLAAMGVMGFFVAPWFNNILKKVTGNPEAAYGAAGPFTLVDNAIKVFKHQERIQDAITRFVTPAPGIELGVEAMTGRNMVTGQKQSLSQAVINRLGPAQAAARIEEGRVRWQDMLLNMAHIKTSDPNRSKLYLMSDDKDAAQAKIDKIKDIDKATAAAEKFNEGQIKQLKQVQKDNNIQGEIPKSVIDKFLVTRSKLGKVVDAETVQQMLSKQKPGKRTKIWEPKDLNLLGRIGAE